MARHSQRPLRELVVCPICKGALRSAAGRLVCASCGRHFVQDRDDYLDLLPASELEEDPTHWQERQQEMNDWYAELLENPLDAQACFVGDYEPFAEFLGRLQGNILDVGGGIGIVRHYLSDRTDYIVIDPSMAWLTTDWSALAEQFPCVACPPRFIRGVGEYLPFPRNTFDAVLSFWSLNHVSNPREVLTEICRVLRVGGQCLLVLEDMAPRRLDVAQPGVLRNVIAEPGASRRSNAARLARHLWNGTDGTTQSDHIVILESDIRAWVAPLFSIEKRSWKLRYLSFVLRKQADTGGSVRSSGLRQEVF